MAQAERMPRYANTCTLPSLTISVKTEEMGWMGSFLIESQSSLRINQVYSWETNNKEVQSHRRDTAAKILIHRCLRGEKVRLPSQPPSPPSDVLLAQLIPLWVSKKVTLCGRMIAHPPGESLYPEHSLHSWKWGACRPISGGNHGLQFTVFLS